MNPSELKKFEFTTEFDAGGRILTAPLVREKRSFNPAEVERIRAESYAAGQNDQLAQAELVRAQALQGLTEVLHKGLKSLEDAAFAQKEACLKIAIEAARKIAWAALDQFPETPLVAAIKILDSEISVQPRLVILASNCDDALKAAAFEAASLAGFAGQISFRDRSQDSMGTFEIQWGEGRADFDPERIAEQIETTLSEALEAEGYHKRKSRQNVGPDIESEFVQL